MSERYQNGDTIPITVTALNGARVKVTGLTDVLLTIRNESGDEYWDFDDSSFKASGWTTRQQQMGEKDSTNSPGVYFYDWDTSGLSDDSYHLEVSSATAASGPWENWAYVGADGFDALIPELGVGVPASTPSLRTGLMLLYMALRNKLDVQTSGTDSLEVHNNAGTKITEKLLTDNGADYSEAKMS